MLHVRGWGGGLVSTVHHTVLSFNTAKGGLVGKNQWGWASRDQVSGGGAFTLKQC